LLGIILTPLLKSLGAIMAIGIAYLFGMMVFWLIARLNKKIAWSHNVLRAYIPPTPRELREYIPYLTATLLILSAAMVLVVLPGVDVLMARHFLSPTTASMYSAASTISSIILFASLPIINLLIPILDSNNISKSTPQLKRAIGALVIIAFVTTCGLYLFPDRLLGILGGAYTSYAVILWIFGINILLVSVITLLVQVLILYRPAIAASISLITLGLALSLMTLDHSSGKSIIMASALSYGIMVTISAIAVTYYAFKRSRLS
jgi:O-antigen/teichoic acid export membrane protein